MELVQVEAKNIQIAAGRELIRRIEACLEDSNSFLIESTLSGRTMQATLENARRLGFEITIVFVFLDSEETCIKRVHQRVKKGGHNVPEADIRRRFHRSISNFWNLYRSLCDHWVLVYNTGNQAQDVATGTSSIVSVRDELLYSQFQELLGP